MRRILLLLVFSAVVIGATASPVMSRPCQAPNTVINKNEMPAEETNIFAVLSNGEKYSGRRVGLTGFAVFYYDRVAIFPTSDHLAADDPTVRVWVGLPRSLTLEKYEALAEKRGRLVYVRGVFQEGGILDGKRIRDTEIIEGQSVLPSATHRK